MLKLRILIREVLNLLIMPVSFRVGRPLLPPSAASIFLTKKCNSRCSICNYWHEQNFDDEIDKESWFKVIDNLASLGVLYINFTADGELLLKKDAFAIMQHSAQKGFQIMINTNGLILDKFINDIISLDPLRIIISLDAVNDDTYFQIRGIKNGFSRVKANILKLKIAGYKRISIGSVLTKDNVSELPLIQKFCTENDFTFRVTAFQFEGFNRNDNSLRKLYRKPDFLEKIKNTVRVLSKYPINNTRIYLKSMIDYYSQNKYHPLNCMVGYYSIFILPDGCVSLCNLMRKDAIIGNIKEHNLNELWHGDDAVYVRKRIKEKKCPSCWLSCFAEDNIRFSVKYFPGNSKYFFSKAIEYFYKR